MKNIIGVLLGGMALVAVSSCGGHDESVSLNTNYLYTNSGSGGGTGQPAKRLIKMTAPDGNGGNVDTNYIWTNGLLTGTTTSDNSVTQTITYNSANQINKIISIEDDGSGQTVTTTYTFTYNGSTLTKVTGVANYMGAVINIIMDYVVTGAQVTKVTINANYQMAGQTQQIATVVNNFAYSGANVSTLSGTAASFNPPSTTQFSTAYSNYDAKKSPYITLPKEYDYFMASAESVSVNNAGNMVVQPGGQSTTYTYLYDTDNYATKRTAGTEVIAYQYNY